MSCESPNPPSDASILVELPDGGASTGPSATGLGVFNRTKRWIGPGAVVARFSGIFIRNDVYDNIAGANLKNKLALTYAVDAWVTFGPESDSFLYVLVPGEDAPRGQNASDVREWLEGFRPHSMPGYFGHRINAPSLGEPPNCYYSDDAVVVPQRHRNKRWFASTPGTALNVIASRHVPPGGELKACYETEPGGDDVWGLGEFNECCRVRGHYENLSMLLESGTHRSKRTRPVSELA